MKTIVLSDTALAGTSYNDTIRGIDMLLNMQGKGNKVIVLSNNPDYSICQIGGSRTIPYRLSFQEFTNLSRRAFGLNVILYNDGKFVIDEEIIPDYTVVGNGIEVLDKEDNTIYQGDFIDQKTLQDMEYTFHQLGYTSLLENMEKQEKCNTMDIESIMKNNTPNNKIVDKYKFLTPTRVEKGKTDEVYAMVCDRRVSFLDSIVIEEVQKVNKDIRGCIVDNKPFFYQEKINKLKAFKHILQTDSSIDLDETVFILDSITDDVLMNKYFDKSYCLSNNFVVSEKVQKEDSLSNVLKKVR